MPTIALSTGSLYTYGIARVFELAAEAGFDAIELLVDQRWDGRQPAYIRRLCQDSGLPVVTIHSPFVPHLPGWPHDPLNRLKESASLARQVGAKVVVTHLPLRMKAAKLEFFGLQSGPWLLPLFVPCQRDYRDFLLSDLAEFEVAEEVLIGVENMPAKLFLGRRVDIHQLNNIETLASLPHLTLDTTHIGTWGLDLLDTYETLKERIVHVHLSNFNGAEHQMPDNGHLPLAELLQRLAGNGFQGAVTVELNPTVLEAEDEVQVRAHLSRSVAFCKEYLS